MYDTDSSLQTSMSISTFRRILKKHLVEYRAPRTLTDFCQRCAHLSDAVLPDCQKAVAHWKGKLCEIMPAYFAAWDVYISDAEQTMKRTNQF